VVALLVETPFKVSLARPAGHCVQSMATSVVLENAPSGQVAQVSRQRPPRQEDPAGHVHETARRALASTLDVALGKGQSCAR
jgi:hypothetical protein